MGRTITDYQEKTLDKLAEKLRGIGPERIKMILNKSETISIRVTPVDKKSMTKMAKSCGLTLTEYLTRLHLLATTKQARIDEK